MLAVLLPVGVPVAIFHYASGRIGNGIMLTLALLVGVVMVVSDLRGAQDEPLAVPEPADGPDPSSGLDEDGDGWLDRPSDAPLPGPFQAAFDEIIRERQRQRQHDRERAASHDPLEREERHEV